LPRPSRRIRGSFIRRDELYLRDIIEAAEAIARFIQNVSRDEFMQDELRQSGVLQKLIVIGEAAARLSDEVKTKNPHIEWADVIGFRNIAVHAYFSVEWPIVWTTATVDVPWLLEQMRLVLEVEFPAR
jgi:uncharacterized protein with HEPN domain